MASPILPHLDFATVQGRRADSKSQFFADWLGVRPFFHNCPEATPLGVINFYDQRVNIKLTEQQKEDLATFLNMVTAWMNRVQLSGRRQ